jgi:hypothetical protein
VKKLYNSIFGTAGRDAVKDFAESLTGSTDLNALHTYLQQTLPDSAERFWIALTQGVGRNNPTQAAAIIAEVTKALDAQKSIQDGVAASAVAASAAQVEAQTKALDAVKGLDNQIKSLSDSIAGEAPEEFMGIVEQQTRARIAGLTQEREAAQASLEKLTDTMTKSLDDVADAIRSLPQAPNWGLPGVPGGGEVPEGAATGGMVGFGRVLAFNAGGFVPRGTDTVPAMLTPGEMILNKAQQRNVAGSIGGSVTIHVNGAGDPKAVADEVMRRLRREKRLQVA